jgi:vesicular inhibitory amino acid transporter
MEILCGLEPHAELNADYTERTIFIRKLLRVLIRIFVVAVIVVMAIIFPSFDRIMALMGSALCFTICIILPLAFYLKIFGKEISRKERLLDWSLLVISSVLAVIGTVWAFLPQKLLMSL